ncbi:squalene/phytoene synthase family protein [Roseobacter sp. EG26]|uniref:squalene/phytoene synthase family protein n=1 Tax=Roseobacter sp. EG26 TaxID=3412477 RepID=UPI003CE4FCDC
MSFDADLTACAALVEKGDPDRFAAAMASPVAARRVLFPLYAFNVEVARAPWVTQEPMIAEMRLQWWRDALEEIAARNTIRRHEVVTPLAALLDPEAVVRLDRLVAARRWDIYKEAFEDEAHFKAYLDDTAAGIMLVAARVLGQRSDLEIAPGDALWTAIEKLGYATGLARFLQAVPALEAQGRIPLVDGRPDAIAQMAQEALAAIRPTRSLKNTLPAALQSALAEAFLTERLLARVVNNPRCVADGTLAVSPLRRSFQLWRWS